MFNERDRRCAAVQLMLSTDTSYDNRTIASTLKIQIRTVQRLRAQLNAPDSGAEWHHQEDPDQGVHRKGPGNHWWNSPAAYSADCLRFRRLNACVKEDLKCRPYRCQTSQILTEKTKNFRLIKSVRPPSSPRSEPAGLLRLVIRREHHQDDLPQHQSQPNRRHPPSIRRAPAEYSPGLWKRHAPSFASVSRWWLRLKAATLNRCQVYNIIKLSELIFSIKVLK